MRLGFRVRHRSLCDTVQSLRVIHTTTEQSQKTMRRPYFTSHANQSRLEDSDECGSSFKNYGGEPLEQVEKRKTPGRAGGLPPDDRVKASTTLLKHFLAAPQR